MYGIRSRVGNIGHEAHLGGALIGLLTALVLVPSVLEENILPVVLIGFLCIVFILLVVFKPEVLRLGVSAERRKQRNLTPDDRYNARKLEVQREVDEILEKVRKYGVESLTSEEKEKLDHYSRRH
jgi:Mg2+/citrate symporter